MRTSNDVFLIGYVKKKVGVVKLHGVDYFEVEIETEDTINSKEEGFKRITQYHKCILFSDSSAKAYRFIIPDMLCAIKGFLYTKKGIDKSGFIDSESYVLSTRFSILRERSQHQEIGKFFINDFDSSSDVNGNN